MKARPVSSVGFTPAPGPLWALTSYFNPSGYARRRSNYRAFRQTLGVPLIAVEMSTGSSFELGPGDADILIQCARGDVMWQKERLLNHGLASLPSSCRYVAWIDSDVSFLDSTWVDRARERLEQVPVVQLFSRVCHLPPDETLHGRPSERADWLTQPSLLAVLEAGADVERAIEGALARDGGVAAVGMAWAARREVLEAHGFFDASIIGGGDTAFACAALCAPDVAVRVHRMNAHQQRAYAAWALPFGRTVAGAVAALPGTIAHLWHGDLRDRGARARHTGLGAFDFDPARDIAVNEHGAWRWSSDKPALHAYLAEYFRSRREDGDLVRSV